MDFRDIVEFIKDMFSYLIIIGIIVLIRIFFIAPVGVVGDSMEPNFKDKEMLLADQLIYKYKDYARFDIVVIKYNSPSHLIKRIIGLPGEKVEYINNKLYIDEKEVKESFEIYGPTKDFSLIDLGYEVIPEGKYFVVGDNRNNSLDSRTTGLIDEKDILGKPFLKVWPIKKLKIIK